MRSAHALRCKRDEWLFSRDSDLDMNIRFYRIATGFSNGEDDRFVCQRGQTSFRSEGSAYGLNI
jgi:hypothetical protein